MKRIALIILSVALVAVSFSGGLSAIAAKPPQVITVSNGFPSGFHFNLNIHGKNPETFTTPNPPPYDPPYGNSIFIPEYTDLYQPITIQCISEKKGGVTELEVIDPYAMPTLYSTGDPTNFENADDLAQFNLPYKIQTDEGIINANGYFVYGRILGKPNNSAKKDGDASSIIVTPNPVIQYDTDGAELPLGMITAQGSYRVEEQQFIRFDDTSSLPNGNGKGRSIAKNITDMFLWTGWIYDGSLDLNLDGVIDFNDVPSSYDVVDPIGTITQEEYDAWLADMVESGLARYYEDWWVFDVAELVVQSWGIENDGTKLLQIRFYPVATTKFTEKAHIVVKKLTEPTTNTTTLFDFTTWDYYKNEPYRSDFQITCEQFCLSHGLDAGLYSVTELAEDGWELTNILIDDPTGSPEPIGNTAYIDLVEGETVTVTFVNTYTP